MTKRKNLLGFANAKTSKGEKSGYLTAILYLAPYNLSGVNLCPKASAGCAKACLFTAGRGAFTNVKDARMAKTLLYLNNKTQFVEWLKEDIAAAERKAKRQGLTLVVRLNGTSDILWERTGIMEAFPHIQFYDYTKIVARLRSPLPPNYHLTFSLSESNDSEAMEALSLGYSVAAVFRDKTSIPSFYLGHPVVDGDSSDLRFLDPKGVVVALVAKGRAKRDTSGFVRDVKSVSQNVA